MARLARVLIAYFVLAGLTQAGADPVVLEDFETLAGWQARAKSAAFKQADSAAVGKGAIRVTLPGMVFKQLSKRPLEGSAAWDRYEGLSFWVKGDGSDLFGSVAIGPRPAGYYSYVCYFPLKNTEWHKVTVAWEDLVPEGQYDPIGTYGALPPSGITAVRFGSRWRIYFNNAKMPKHTYCIDQIQIEEKVEKPGPVPKPRPFSEVVDLLKAKKKVHIVCMGDSITAGTGLADRDKERYAVRMQELLREWLGYDDIICESRAVGGARLTDARAWTPRDFVGEPPDLVTILYGYNDKSSAYTKDYFKRSLNDYIDRIARKTQGKTAILPLATIPGTGPRFVMMDDYADAVRETAKERGLACFDLQKVFKAIGRDKIESYFHDQAHPNAEGHQIIADAIVTFLVKSAGITTPKPKPKAKAAVLPGKEHAWSFEPNDKQWLVKSDEIALSQEKASSGKTALKFLMKAKAKAHRCAYSPAFAVSQGQRYRIEAKTFCSDVTSGTIGIYACAYTNAKAEGSPDIKSVRSASNMTGRWEALKGDFTVPTGAVALKILVWSRSDSVGTFYVDDVKVIPQ
ncbi:MAG: hypothetical protein GXP25_08630 [Planctomycetes bacterium]|nr:hypothetical protein [Planctomycetota bacterium]